MVHLKTIFKKKVEVGTQALRVETTQSHMGKRDIYKPRREASEEINVPTP